MHLRNVYLYILYLLRKTRTCGCKGAMLHAVMLCLVSDLVFNLVTLKCLFLSLVEGNFHKITTTTVLLTVIVLVCAFSRLIAFFLS